ncbi:hypothetical protein I3760_04G053400 [Carya illinoinensis]|nr:hypothetical protein I3760_04G053400 [Carya illinoinensis]
MANMLKFSELPDCCHPNQPVLIYPSSPTPKHFLYLSNLDDRSLGSPFYKKSIGLDSLKYSLSRVWITTYWLGG